MMIKSINEKNSPFIVINGEKAIVTDGEKALDATSFPAINFDGGKLDAMTVLEAVMAGIPFDVDDEGNVVFQHVRHPLTKFPTH